MEKQKKSINANENDAVQVKTKKTNRLKKYFDDYKRISFEPYAAGVLFLYLIHPLMNIFLQIFYWAQKKILWTFMNDYIEVILIVSALFCFIGIMFLIEQNLNHKKDPERYPGAVRKVFRKESFVSLIMFLCLAAWEFIATIVTGLDYAAFFENDYGHYGYISYVLCYFLWFGCAAAIRSDSVRMKLMKIGVWCAAIDVVWSIGYSLFLNLNLEAKWYTDFVSMMNMTTNCYYRERLWKFTGGFANQNHFGYYIATMAVVCGGILMYEKTMKKKIMYAILLGIISYGLTACDTTGAWLAALCGFILLIIGARVKDGHFNWMTVFALLIFWIVSFTSDIWLQHITPSILQLFTDVGSIAADPENSDMAGTKRWGLWRKSFEQLIPRSPIFGYGVLKYIGNESYMIDNSPHNEVIEYALTYGLPAAIFYVFIVLFIFFRDLKNRKSLSNGAFIAMAGAFTYFVSSMFGVLFLYTAPFFFIFLGMGISDKEYPDGVLPAPEEAINQELIDEEAKKKAAEYRAKRDAANKAENEAKELNSNESEAAAKSTEK